MNRRNAYLTRRSFLALGGASFLYACSRDKDFMLIKKSAESSFPPLGRIEKINGLDFHSFETGNGATTAIFIHGANINLRDWVIANSALTKSKYKSIYIDRPGFGYSKRGSVGLTAKKQADQIRKFVKKHNIKKPILVSHSWGSIVVLEWALEYPDELLGIVIVSGVNMPYSSIAKWFAKTGILETAVEIYSNSFNGIHFNDLAKRFSKSVFAPQSVPKDYLQGVGVELSRRRLTVAANSQDLAQTTIVLNRLEKNYDKLTLPIEVIHGEEDFLLPASLHAYDFVKKLPNSRLTILKGVGHMAHHADPYSTRNAIERIMNI